MQGRPAGAGHGAHRRARRASAAGTEVQGNPAGHGAHTRAQRASAAGGVAQARLTGELHGMQARWHSGPEQHKGVEGGQKIFPSAQLEHSPRRRRGIRTLHVKIATAQDAML